MAGKVRAMGATGRGRHLAWHNLIDLVRLGINILELILFY
jgi:hypothetical protein